MEKKPDSAEKLCSEYWNIMNVTCGKVKNYNENIENKNVRNISFLIFRIIGILLM
jgi:hypothetical protein